MSISYLKIWWFKKSLLNKLINQLKISKNNHKVITYSSSSDTSIEFLFLVGENGIFIKKQKNQNIEIINFDLNNKHLSLDILNNLMKVKDYASAIESQHIIEVIDKNLIKYLKYLSSSQKEVFKVYESCINLSKEMMKENLKPLVVDNPNNKWID